MEHANYVSTTNACKLCKPLGACLAFRGIEGAVPMLHGSQGCATYMRRYIISHSRTGSASRPGFSLTSALWSANRRPDMVDRWAARREEADSRRAAVAPL